MARIAVDSDEGGLIICWGGVGCRPEAMADYALAGASPEDERTWELLRAQLAGARQIRQSPHQSDCTPSIEEKSADAFATRSLLHSAQEKS